MCYHKYVGGNIMKNMKETNLIKVDLNSFKLYRGLDSCATSDDNSIDMCGGGRCPRVLKSENGDVLIQGYSISQEDMAALGIPNGENIIFLSKEILSQLKIKFE